jgi:hypothetical protein
MAEDQTTAQVELLYPFYLDTDMTLAFSAALTGGVALETESVEHTQREDQSTKKLRAGLRIFDLLDLGGGIDKQGKESANSESRVVRRHTEASIFINLIDELRRRQMIVEPDIGNLKIGEIVSIEVGPATAPLLRVVDQVLRLLEITNPEPDAVAPPQQHPTGGKHGTKSGRVTPASVRTPIPEPDPTDAIRTMFRSLKGDLEFSGMTDIVVRREGDLNVLLTLDNRFISEQALEMLHTSTSRVIGKVTQIWVADTDIINLYRRSVLSLVPALPSAMGFLVFGLLGGLAKAIDVNEIQRSTNDALGIETPDQQPQEIRFGDDLQAVFPVMQGPALQILPLAVCA